MHVSIVTYICSYNDCFDSLNNKLTSKLSLGDDLIIEVMGVGNVKINTFNGVVHILDNLAYVPKM